MLACNKPSEGSLVIDGEYIWKYTTSRLRLQRAGQYADHFPDRMAELEDSRICVARQRAGLSRLQRAGGHVERGRPVLYSPARRSRRDARSAPLGVFRIDHDEEFNMTAHMQYQTPWKRGPWVGFNWRYDSGLVAGAVPCYGPRDSNDLPAIDFV